MYGQKRFGQEQDLQGEPSKGSTNCGIDWPAFEGLIEWHIEQGTCGIVPVGTTGESATLTVEEHLEVIQFTVDRVNKRIPVIAGTGGNATEEAVHLSKQAVAVGVDACLVVTPYYNRPTQEGLYRHYEHLALTIDSPIVLYNVPPRTAVDLLPETVGRLSKIENIIGIKEACGDPNRVTDILSQSESDFFVLSGEDAQTLQMMGLGACGTISVTANVCPALVAKVCEAQLTGDSARATELDALLQPLHHALFIEPNPTPVKWALYEMGKIQSGIRLPLLPMSSGKQEELRACLKAMALL
ncbi:MAG: 4-hydroxy-tetrahydrodipicolinate synthase [Pseudomonadales bacterium]|nr:4-hydroxy-tetrahydrodipicolinate synthase [Pseudomonadales bacterium]